MSRYPRQSKFLGGLGRVSRREPGKREGEGIAPFVDNFGALLPFPDFAGCIAGGIDFEFEGAADIIDA
jgi:hypothetical protein